MAITLEEALRQLNIPEAPTGGDLLELELYIDAANEWISERVTTTSPAPVRLATLMLLDHLWETQRGPAGSPLEPDLDQGTTGSGFAVPNRVVELITPWLVEGLGDVPASPIGSFPDAPGWPDPVERTPRDRSRV